MNFGGSREPQLSLEKINVSNFDDQSSPLVPNCGELIFSAREAPSWIRERPAATTLYFGGRLSKRDRNKQQKQLSRRKPNFPIG